MFFTSAITSLFPYILLMGVFATYYLGIFQHIEEPQTTDSSIAAVYPQENEALFNEKIAQMDKLKRTQPGISYEKNMSAFVKGSRPLILSSCLHYDSPFLIAQDTCTSFERALFTRPPPRKT